MTATKKENEMKHETWKKNPSSKVHRTLKHYYLLSYQRISIMAKKSSKSKKTKKVKAVQEEQPPEEMESSSKVTLEQIDAMSDGEEDEIEEWNAEAKALRQAIAEGVFDKIKKTKPSNNDFENAEDSDEEEEQDAQMEGDNSEEDETSEEEIQSTGNQAPAIVSNKMKALRSVTTELVMENLALPWPEKFEVVPSTPLPFGQMTDEGLPIQVHDDLKREVAFYNLALEAVHTARIQCEKLQIPFSRPEDFFAEMVKTDGTFHFLLLLCLASIYNRTTNPIFQYQITWQRSKTA